MKALVTGGAGFIGSHIVDALLARGDSVVVLDDLSTGKKENLAHVWEKITFIEGTITTPSIVMKAAEGVDVIFHQAAVASIQKSIENPWGTHDVNVNGTLHVFNAAAHSKIPVVYASSSAVYGDSPEIPKREDMSRMPKTPYAIHKGIAEDYARVHGEIHGLRAIGLRYFNVFGPRQDASSPYSGVISLFNEKISKQEPITINGDGKTTRDFVYVSDVVAANLLAAEKGKVGDVYNIGTEKETSLLDLVGVLEKTHGVSATVSHGPERVGDIRRSVADIGKAKKELGWQPEISFEEGVKLLVNWS